MVSDPKNEEMEIIIGEDDNVKSILIQVNEDDLSTTVLSDLSPDENIDYLLEAVGANAQELVKQGKNKDIMIEELRDLFEHIIDYYLEDLED